MENYSGWVDLDAFARRCMKLPYWRAISCCGRLSLPGIIDDFIARATGWAQKKRRQVPVSLPDDLVVDRHQLAYSRTHSKTATCPMAAQRVDLLRMSRDMMEQSSKIAYQFRPRCWS